MCTELRLSPARPSIERTEEPIPKEEPPEERRPEPETPNEPEERRRDGWRDGLDGLRPKQLVLVVVLVASERKLTEGLAIPPSIPPG